MVGEKSHFRQLSSRPPFVRRQPVARPVLLDPIPHRRSQRTDSPSHLIEVMEALIVSLAPEVLLPRCKYQQRTCSTGIKAAQLRLPIRTDRLILDVYHAMALYQAFVLDALLTFADAWGHQHITLCCYLHQAEVFIFSVEGLLGRYFSPIALSA